MSSIFSETVGSSSCFAPPPFFFFFKSYFRCFFSGTFVFCLCSYGYVLRLRRVWLQDLHINTKPRCLVLPRLLSRQREKKIDVYTEEQQRTKATTQVSTVLPCMLCVSLQGTVKIFNIQRTTNHLGCEGGGINIYSRPSISRVNHSQNNPKTQKTK